MVAEEVEQVQEQGEEQVQEVQAQEFELTRMQEEVVGLVEKENANDAHAQHGYVLSDDVVCQDIGLQAQVDDSGICLECYINTKCCKHSRSKHQAQDVGDNGKEESQEHVDHVQSDGQQSMPAQEKQEGLP